MTDCSNKSLENCSQATSDARLCGEHERMVELSAGIGHDFNHVLNIIRGYTNLLLEELSENESAHKKLLQIDKAIERGVSLSRQLVSYRRSDHLPRTLIDVNLLVEDLQESFTSLLVGPIELDVILGTNIGSVMIHPGQLQQVLMNLALNACEAMPNGGRLTIRTASCDFHEFAADYPHEINPCDGVLIEVSDTGYGIPPAVKPRIFDAFFTTKAETGGTGLGLANVLEILKRSRGKIRVDSELGKGTTFKVFLPCEATGGDVTGRVSTSSL